MRRRPSRAAVVAALLAVSLGVPSPLPPLDLPFVDSVTPVAADPSSPIATCPTGTSVDGFLCTVRFTSTSTWTVPEGVSAVDVLAVGGGGGGGGGYLYTAMFLSRGWYAGGGGGGGDVETCTLSGLTAGQELTVTVGQGGSGGGGSTKTLAFDDALAGNSGGNGQQSGVGTCTASGGTGGASATGNWYREALVATTISSGGASGGSGVGGTGFMWNIAYDVWTMGGGGGGASARGTNASMLVTGDQNGPGVGGAGVDGLGGGGGGGAMFITGYTTPGSGTDGGGNGASPGSNGSNATANTGGGGGGGAATDSSAGNGGNGGSGVVEVSFRAHLEIGLVAVDDTKVYDGTPTSTLPPAVTAGALFPGDVLTDCPQEFDSDESGDRTISISEDCKVLDANGVDVTSFYTLTIDDTPASGEITRATPTCSNTAVYTGDPIPVVCVGVDGEELTGTTTATAPTDVGSHTVTYSHVDGTGNYDDVTDGTATVVITKADPVCTVTGISASYDTTARRATGSCLGVKGETLDGLDLSTTERTDVGDYGADPWTFTDETGNYNDTNGTVASTVSKSQAAVTYTGPSEVYVNGTLDLSADVNHDWCTSPVGYTITPHPVTGIDSLQVTGSTTSTDDWIIDTPFTVTAAYPEDSTCLPHSDDGEIRAVLRPQTVSWSTTSTHWDIDSPVQLDAAVPSGDGAIGYTVTRRGSAGCSLAGKAGRRLTAQRAGTCEVRATAARTGNYLEGSTTRRITIAKARVPGQVRDLEVVSVNPKRGRVTLEWRTPADTGTHPLITYRVRVRERHEEYRVFGFSRPGVRTMTVDGLEPGAHYLRVRARNAAGSGLGFVVGPVFITG